MSSIEDLRGIQNPLRTYEWEVEITGPASLGGEEGLTSRAQTVAIPEVSVEPIELNHKSEKTVYAGRVASARTMTINFFDDENLTVYRFFKQWMQLIHNENTGGGVSRSAYIAGLSIKQLSQDSETVIATHTITGAFPTSIGEQSLSYDDSSILTLDITLSYQTHNVD